MQSLLEELREWTLPEVVAVALAIGYLVLAIRQNIWCWVCAGISTAIYVWLFASARLYMESALNLFYFAMAVYGYLVWRDGGADDSGRPVVVWPISVHAMAIAAVIIATSVSGFLLAEFTDAVYPYIDSATTFAAIWATFLVARKVLENWWYWLVIDAASVIIYWSRDLQLTALLFVLYVVLIPIGLVSWTRSYRRNTGVAVV